MPCVKKQLLKYSLKKLNNSYSSCVRFESNNQIHGRTKNPYDTNRIVGGSSGGDGCLLAASGCPLGIGTDLGGSIRIPSAFNGIFGHKPSMSVVPSGGLFPRPEGRFCDMLGIGPMCRFAEDLLPALKVLAGKNANQLRLDESVDVTKLKVFYQTNDGGSLFTAKVEPEVQTAVRRAVEHFRGICTLQPPTETNIKHLKDNFDIIANYMSQIDMAPLITDGKGLIRFAELFKIMFGWSKHTFHTILMVGKLNGKIPEECPELEEKEIALHNDFETMLGNDGVFLYPTQPTVALFHNEPIVQLPNFGYTTIANLLGLPSTAVPMGLGSEGLPIGMQVIAGRNQDRLCLAVAMELEKVFGGWVEPGISG